MPRKATNVTLDEDLLAEARALEVNISRAAENGVTNAVREARKTLWQEENRAAIDSANAWVEENGLPLEQSRMF